MNLRAKIDGLKPPAGVAWICHRSYERCKADVLAVLDEGGEAVTTPWQKPTPDMLFTDGRQYLVACRYVNRHKPGTYYLEYEIITANCDSETPVRFTCNGDSWDGDWDDVEYFIPLSMFCLTQPALNITKGEP